MRRLAIALATLTLAFGVAQGHAEAATTTTAADVAAWDAAVKRAQIEAWNIAVWNQAVVNAEVGFVPWDCNVMLVHLVANGADRHDLRHWLYIGRRESHCILSALADRPRTGDYSVCWFQINYFRGLRAGRTAAFGPPELLRTSGDACASAAIRLKHGAGWAPWGG